MVPSLPPCRSQKVSEPEREKRMCVCVCGAQKQSSLAPPRVKRTQNRTEQKASEVKRRGGGGRERRGRGGPTKKGRKEGTELKKERASGDSTAVSEKRAEQSRAALLSRSVKEKPTRMKDMVRRRGIRSEEVEVEVEGGSEPC